MDLRDMLNAPDGGAGAKSRSPAARPSTGGGAPAPSPIKPPPPAAMPGTPGQAMPPQSFRDYSHGPQASPSRSLSREYPGPPHTPSAPFPSPLPNHQGGPPPYGSRPAPPPLQPLSNMDPRSPSVGSGPAPSPYRHTPGGSISGPAGGYPFPPTQPPAGSPVQRHQYPPAGPYPPRDSFSQPSGPDGMTGHPGHPSYMQGQPMPQTPPVGTPGGAHIYPHQRSHSTHSTPTPTSAHSQSQYGAPYVQGSPVLTHQPPPHQPYDQMRHPSHPPSHGPPPPPSQSLPAGQRATSVASGYSQPQSPYQARAASLAGGYAPLPQQAQPSPPPPPPTAIPRSQSIYDAQTNEAHRRSLSRSEQSVSPKTRKPSISNSVSADQPDPRYIQQLQPKMAQAPHQDRERAVTPAKRKMGDRDLGPDDLDQRQARPAPFEGVNGSQAQQRPGQTTQMSSSPQIKREKKPRRKAMPVWAAEFDGRPLNAGNFVLHKPAGIRLNGTTDGAASKSRHQTPDSVGREVNSQPAPSVAPTPAQLPASSLLGAWEPCITNEKPFEEMQARVTDFLYLQVVGNPELGSIQAFGAQFEIEAKLGVLVSKDTLSRVNPRVHTECVLEDDGRTTFKSAMSEDQHMKFNNFLNDVVLATDPRNPKNANLPKPRVPLVYKHRREIDRFFELPGELQELIPPAIRNFIPRNHTPKVRVTYDQKTNEVLAKIIKARVGDLSIHFPASPLDCRISVNLEMAWDGSVEQLEAATKGNRNRQPDRNKDRLSYTQGHYQIDLTQVTQMVSGVTSNRREEKDHELEIELAADTLVEHGRRLLRQEKNAFAELIEGFLDNVRLLARKGAQFDPE